MPILETATDKTGKASLNFEWRPGLNLEIYSMGFQMHRAQILLAPEQTPSVVLEVASMGGPVEVVTNPQHELPVSRVKAPTRLQRFFLWLKP